MKEAERTEARRLRQEEGSSVRSISRRLGVSKSSVSRWVRDITLTKEQQRALDARARSADPTLATSVFVANRRADRKRFQEEGRQVASLGEWLHVAGCMLFWGEGKKRRNVVSVANSDPALLVLFTRFLLHYFELTPEEILIHCTFYTNGKGEVEKRRIEEYWLNLLGLPRTSLRASVVDRYPDSSYGKKAGRLPNGVCTLTVHRTDIVQHIYGALQVYAQVDRPEWLDLPK